VRSLPYVNQRTSGNYGRGLDASFSWSLFIPPPFYHCRCPFFYQDIIKSMTHLQSF
jgi:hypothetical protein